MIERMGVDEFNKKYRNGGDPKKVPSERKRLENIFMEMWLRCDGNPRLPVEQFQFHATRKWRFDFAWPAVRLAVEIQGGGFVNGKHNRGATQAKDHEKMNAAQADGWCVLQYGTKAMGNPSAVVREVLLILRSRSDRQP